jgi:Redoxin
MARRAATARRREAARLFTRFVIALPLVGALGLAAWIGLFAAPESERLRESFRLGDGEALPYVQVTDASGGSTTLREVAQGGRRLLLVMDDDCPHCHDELRLLRSLTRSGELPAEGVAVVSVSRQEKYAGLARRYSDLAVLNDVNGAFRARLGLAAVPAVVAVGADGRVAQVRFGLQTLPQLKMMAAAAGLAVAPAARR